MDIRAAEISPILKSQIANFGAEAEVTEVGQVLSVGDGIARAIGLDKVQAGEMVEFENGTRGMAVGLRCAIYTRVSTDQGLEQDFNSLDAQREASEAYIKSQAHEGWRLVREHYDDGGFSGGSMDRPALQKLLIDVQARRIDVIVVYKVDRLTRSLADFAKLVETFDAHGVSFVSVTQRRRGRSARH